MDLKQLKQDMKIVIGLTWFNFNSGKPDLIDITNGCTDKYVPSTTALVVPNSVADKAYFWDKAEQEKVLRERLFAIGFPNSYALGATVDTHMHYSPGFAPKAKFSAESLGCMDSVELDVFRSFRGPGISEFEPIISKTRTEGAYVGLRYDFGDPKKPSGAA